MQLIVVFLRTSAWGIDLSAHQPRSRQFVLLKHILATARLKIDMDLSVDTETKRPTKE